MLWLQDLAPKDRPKARKESEDLVREIEATAKSTLAIGEHLLNLQDLAREERIFVKILADFPFSVATAYRYMQTASVVKANLTEPVFARASLRGLKIIGANEKHPLGKFTRVIKQMPPPKSADPVTIDRWIDQVVDTHKMEKRAAGSKNLEYQVEEPDAAMEHAFKAFRRRAKRLPNNSRTRLNWLKNFVGMCMTEMKIQNAETFTPVVIPDSFRVPVGRPPKNEA